jgi:hypothetical protein
MSKQFLPLRGRALVRHRRMKPVTQWRWYYCRACYRLGQKDAVDIYSVAVLFGQVPEGYRSNPTRTSALHYTIPCKIPAIEQLHRRLL